MTYLLTLSIGPVQEFIAAARKTADLYAGSRLLLEVVQAAVKALPADGLIFPANPESEGANKILVVVDDDPAGYAQQAEAAAQAKLLELWAQYTKDIQQYVSETRAKAQLEAFLEVYAAWVPLPDEARYNEARRKVDALLAARKALRNFAALDQADAGIPKSPLDPAFATVFKGGKVPKELEARYNFKATEVLDAVSLLKRMYGRTLKDVPSTSDLAHAGATAEAKKKSSFRPKKEVPDDSENIPAYPYFAILLADGDSMGQLLNKPENNSPKAHQTFSGQLDRFAQEAPEIVKAHEGFLVYAGGDDVLALLPVNKALACGQALAQAFKEKVKGGTLSAGIAMVHYREPLSTSLEQARHAEKQAKQVDDKDAVCVALHTRGGAPLMVAQKWSSAQEIQEWQTKTLPRGLPYELRELAREWPADLSSDALSAEAQRIAGRKSNAEGQKLTEQDIIEMVFGSVGELKQFADMLVLTRFLSGKGDRT